MILARTWASEPQTRSGLEELFFGTRNSVGIFELREDRFFKNVLLKFADLSRCIDLHPVKRFEVAAKLRSRLNAWSLILLLKNDQQFILPNRLPGGFPSSQPGG